MEHLFNELNIPKKCIKNTKRDDRFVVIVHKLWLKALLKHSKLIECFEKPNFEVWPETDAELGQEWTKIFVRVFLKSENKVIPLPKIRGCIKNEPPLMFSQLLQYVSITNYKNLWKEAFKKYSNSSESMQSTQITLASYNEVLREVIQRTYGCSLVNICDSSLSVQCSENNYDTPSNIVPAVVAIETLNAIFLLHISHFSYNLYNCVFFSPAILDKCYTKPLFIVYQLLHCFKSLHDRSLTLGDITLHDIYLNEDLWIQIFPQLLSNLHVQDMSNADNKKPSNIPECQKIGHKFLSSLKCINCGLRMYDKVQVSDESLHKLCELWVRGDISNFTYITALNNAAGRIFGDPNCHHVFPWVSNFTSPCGKNWRDLKKSKFRLNKGDCQLDLTFENPLTQVPHHVSDVLSPITYYVYMARRTPRSVLCKNVRSNWVPAEYPSSLQRLQEWTPDECIPEFFVDPTVFKSIHDDLDDLEVPPWSSSPEDFVQQHREILESPHVSERLHHWIDLTFGFKLSGNAAVKSKNVCLHLVDGHKNLTKSGIVQLFTLPHPPKKETKSVFWAKSPPKIYVEKPSRHRKRERSTSSAQNTEDKNENETNLNDDGPQTTAKISPLAFSRLLSRSRSSLSEDQRDNKMSRSPSAQRSASVGPKNSSPSTRIIGSGHFSVPRASLNDGVIYLPKEYNPALALSNIEQFHGFMSKTFHEEQYKQLEENFSVFSLQEGKQKTNSDYLYSGENSLVQNAFTNRYFSENIVSKLDKHFDDGVRYFNYHKYNSRKLKNENQITCNYSEIVTTRKVRELQILGCLIVEIFMGKQLCAFTRYNGTLSFLDRLKACVTVLRSSQNEIPRCIRYLVNLLLQPNCTDFSTFKYPSVTDMGLPPPSPHLLLEPLLHCIIPFPKSFYKLYFLLSSLKNFTDVSNELNILYNFVCDGQKCLEYENVERTKILFSQNIGECKVKKCARNLDMLMKDLNPTVEIEVVHLLLPYVKELLEESPTAVLAAWYLFDPVANMLGPRKTTEYLLNPLLKLYENELNQYTIPFYTKSAKLYHHSFLLRLIVRFGLKTFLDNFVTTLVEGVGGYRDYDKVEFILHTHTQKAFRKCSNLKSMDSEDQNDASPDDNPSSSSDKVELAKDPSPKSKSIPEPEVFEFENEPNTETCYQSLIEQLELNVCTDLPLNHSTAEEALDANIAENLEQLRSLEELNLNLSDIDTKQEILSPTVTIPCSTMTNIPCEIGSKKSESDYFVGRNLDGSKVDPDSPSSKSFKLERSKSDCSQSISSGSFLTEHSKSLSQLRKSEGKISEMSADSIIWLSHRLGPVLTAKHLSRNLLKMLTLCYVGHDNLVSIRRDGENDHYSSNNGTDLISIASSRVVGDENATKVLECLSHIAGLYGEQLILVQYLPHMSEMINLCKKRLTPNLEGGLISCLALLQHIIPYLSDSTLMNHLQDFILKSILHPIIRLLGTTKYCFPSSYTARDILARKYLDTLYLLSLRIGVEMTRENLIVPALQRFFMIFDKAAGTVRERYDTKKSSAKEELEESHFIEVRRDGSMMEWSIGGTPIKISHIKDEKEGDSLSPLPTKDHVPTNIDESVNQALQELRAVFTAELAHTAYIPFLKQVGLPTLTSSLLNHAYIRNFCEEYEQEVKLTYPNINQNMSFLNANIADPGRTNASVGSIGSNIALIGNRIDVQTETTHSNSVDLLSLVSNKMENSTRHLRGNWLAYWEHEIGRSDKDLMFNFKQIRLQSFSGHGNSVKCLHVLDNENSFMSGSRDKTVKLWSLRSQGDGTSVSTCQWTYTSHKKSILAITFLEGMRLAASCDSVVHLWDPFMGVNVGYLESSKYPPVNMLRCMPSPSSLLYASTTDGTIRVIDARTCTYIHELKVTLTPGGLIRCLAVAPSGNWVATGQSSGQITVLDGRTGLIISSWRAHEGEVLQLLALNENTLISSSLDQTTGVWNPQDGKHKFQMKGNTEPVHCLLNYNSELISGTTANRIGVHTSIDRDACFSSTKLRSDAFKGLLTSMAILPLNRLLLLGADNGNITLLC